MRGGGRSLSKPVSAPTFPCNWEINWEIREFGTYGDNPASNPLKISGAYAEIPYALNWELFGLNWECNLQIREAREREREIEAAGIRHRANGRNFENERMSRINWEWE